MKKIITVFGNERLKIVGHGIWYVLVALFDDTRKLHPLLSLYSSVSLNSWLLGGDESPAWRL